MTTIPTLSEGEIMGSIFSRGEVLSMPKEERSTTSSGQSGTKSSSSTSQSNHY